MTQLSASGEDVVGRIRCPQSLLLAPGQAGHWAALEMVGAQYARCAAAHPQRPRRRPED